jgi:hypothetical protein
LAKRKMRAIVEGGSSVDRRSERSCTPKRSVASSSHQKESICIEEGRGREECVDIVACGLCWWRCVSADGGRRPAECLLAARLESADNWVCRQKDRQASDDEGPDPITGSRCTVCATPVEVGLRRRAGPLQGSTGPRASAQEVLRRNVASKTHPSSPEQVCLLGDRERNPVAVEWVGLLLLDVLSGQPGEVNVGVRDVVFGQWIGSKAESV